MERFPAHREGYLRRSFLQRQDGHIPDPCHSGQPDGLLRPNQYVRVRLKGTVRHNAILVPQRAVQQTSKGHVVWVVGKENKAESRPVTVGEWHENDWFIYEGLQRGDQVVVDGVLTLRPGSPLKVVLLSDKTKADGGGTAASDSVKSGGQEGTGRQ